MALTVGGVGSFGGDDKSIFKVDQFLFPQHAVCLRLGKICEPDAQKYSI